MSDTSAGMPPEVEAERLRRTQEIYVGLPQESKDLIRETGLGPDDVIDAEGFDDYMRWAHTDRGGLPTYGPDPAESLNHYVRDRINTLAGHAPIANRDTSATPPPVVVATPEDPGASEGTGQIEMLREIAAADPDAFVGTMVDAGSAAVPRGLDPTAYAWDQAQLRGVAVDLEQLEELAHWLRQRAEAIVEVCVRRLEEGDRLLKVVPTYGSVFGDTHVWHAARTADDGAHGSARIEIDRLAWVAGYLNAVAEECDRGARNLADANAYADQRLELLQREAATAASTRPSTAPPAGGRVRDGDVTA